MSGDADPKSKRVLVVDDDESICMFVKTLLEKEGFATEMCFSGQEALDVVDRRDIDLIVLDWMMPVLSGFEVLKSLQTEKHGMIPVLVITARVTDQTTADIIRQEMNVADFFPKPIRHRDFVERVHQILNTKPTQRP